MKKSVKTIAVTGLIIGALAVGGIGTVVMASGNAYETYKDAALSITASENHTTTINFSAKENGVLLFSGSSLTMVDGADSYTSTQVEGNGQSVDNEASIVEGTVIRRTGEQYTSAALPDTRGEWQRPDVPTSSTKLMGMVTDLLVGDVKTHFTSSGEIISANLSGAQIPELANVAFSAMLEQNGNRITLYEGSVGYADILSSIPIQKDAVIKSVHLEAVVTNGDIAGQDIVLILAGTDADGTSREVEFTIKTETSNIGATDVQPIDTSGKDVTETNYSTMR